MGRARRLAVAVGLDSRGLDARGGHRQPQPAGEFREPRHGCARLRELRIPAVHRRHVESLRAHPPGACRRPRSESRAAGSGARHSSAASLYGLRRLRRGLRVRVRRHARRQARPGVGEMDAALDHDGLVLPFGGHRARQLVGLLRTRLGRLLVLGSGGERLVHALAGGNRAHPFAGGHGKARRCSRAGRCCWPFSRSP